MSLSSRVIALVFGLAALAAARPALALQPPSAGSVSAQTLKLPDGPASVRGLADSPSINGFSGQVDYAIPIEVPTAAGGIAPSLELRYSGTLGNGPFGVGWSLEVPQVRRVERNGVPSFTTADELEIDGIGGSGRLVGAADGTYRVEGQPTKFRITKSGDGFLVQRADGVSMLLGAAPEARREASGRIATWLVQEITDVSGQKVVFHYGHDRGQVYLSDVAWGPGETYHVRLHYGSRPDTVVSYRSGFEIVTALRADSIDVESHGEVLRSYELTYDDALPLTRLARVRCKGRGRAAALPDLTLTYAAPAAAAAPVLMTNPADWALNVRGTALIDVDGDSVADLLRLDPAGHSYCRNLGNGSFAMPVPVPNGEGIGTTDGRLIDLDGDARPELVVAIGGTWRVRRLVAGAWVSAGIRYGSLNVPLTGSGVVLTDLNGDGRTDVVRPSTNGLFVNFQTPTGLGPTTSLPPISPDDVNIVPGASNVRVHDVNGDGLADFVWLADGWIKVFLGTGDGRFVAQPRGAYPWADSFVDASNVHLADLNRDGLMDLVRFSAGNLEWYAGLPGAGFRATPVRIARPETVDFDAVLSVADTNGNGSEDVVWSSARGLWVLDLAGTTSAGMLTRVDNGLGKTTAFTYSSAAALSVTAAAAGQPWQSFVPTSIPVAVSTTESTGAGDPDRVVRYTVRDGFWDGVERRFGGFLSSTQRPDAPVAPTVEVIYERGDGDRRVLRGDPLVVRTRDGSGNLVLVRTFTRDAITPTGLGTSPLARVGVVRQVDEEHYEGLSTPAVTRITYAIDSEGRVTEEQRLGRIDVTGDESASFTTYASDDASWVRDKVVTHGTRDAAGQVLRMSRTFYGDNSTLLPLGQIGRGWPRRAESRLVDPARGEVWTVDEEMQYDALGNVVAHFDGNAWHARTYDADSIHVVEESVTSSGRVIRYQATWDAVSGLQTSETGPNGETTYNTYDALGRVTSRAHVEGLPFVLYRYDWTSPRPTTTIDLYERDESTLSAFSQWAPGSGWRESTAVTNGAGELLFTATRLDASTVIISDWAKRDELGQLVFKGEPFYWTQPTQPTAPPTDLKGHSFTFDALGRTVAHSLPTGGVRHTSYSAFDVVTTTDGLAPVTTHLDGLGRVTRTSRTVNGIAETVDASYDPTGAITALSLQGGQVTHTFTYDGLGRLVATNDPESGVRTLRYDDADHLLEQVNGIGQSVTYEYDDIGRVTTTRTQDGRAFVYHYDVAKDGVANVRALGRVAWIEEPTGEVQIAYDARGRMGKLRRTVRGRSLEETPHYSPMGTVIGTQFDDGFGYDITFDDAGRVTQVGDFWQALALDARGGVTKERFGNGIVGRFERDEMGQPSRLRIERASGAALYDVAVQRNAFGAILSVQDGDGVGLDHTATYAYDAAGRLTQAVLGPTARQYAFSYAYDGLQNMVTRTASGPRPIGALVGTYVYGEGGRSPRQVTSVTSAGGTTRLAYDPAGRVVQDGDTTLVYDAFDALLQALAKTGNAIAAHDYGYDGLRTYTRNADGSEQIWLSGAVTEKDGRREHTIDAEGRTIAKASAALSELPPPNSAPIAPPTASMTTTGASTGSFSLGALAGALLVAGWLFARAWRIAPALQWKPPVRAAYALGVLVSVVIACAPAAESREDAARVASAWTATARTYFHQGFAAGPVLFTRGDGTVEEERLYEPFGVPLEAQQDGRPGVGDIDFRLESRNELNAETDFNTGFSYHGARWMAPTVARWLTPDPPTRAPDPKFLIAPWDLNPYSFVRSNPLVYWDPDGHDWKSFAKGFVVGAAKAAVTAVVVSAVVAAAPEIATAVAVASVAMAAYSVYQNRHELVAMGQRVVAGTTTDADHEAVGEMLGGIVGGRAGGAVGTRVGGAVRSGATPITPKPAPAPAPKPSPQPRPRCTGALCSKSGCFVAGTLVLTDHGAVPIEQIAAGDWVLSRDAETGETTYRRVEDTFRRHKDVVEDLELADAQGHLEQITTTEEHPFWVHDRGWVRGDHLTVGDRLERADGSLLELRSVRLRAADTDVYNFRVEDFHTYFVADGVWVHNADCDTTGGAAKGTGGTFRSPDGRLRKANGTFAPDGGPKRVTGGKHGNTAGPQTAILYKRYDADGNFLKHGVTQELATRYTEKELNGGYLVEQQRGPRSEILKIERNLVETDPGPLNREPWAGTRKQP